jgi:hypothetical protein
VKLEDTLRFATTSTWHLDLLIQVVAQVREKIAFVTLNEEVILVVKQLILAIAAKWVVFKGELIIVVTIVFKGLPKLMKFARIVITVWIINSSGELAIVNLINWSLPQVKSNDLKDSFMKDFSCDKLILVHWYFVVIQYWEKLSYKESHTQRHCKEYQWWSYYGLLVSSKTWVHSPLHVNHNLT